MFVPTIVMSAIVVPMNHDIVSIMNHNLRGRRNSTEEQCPHRRTQNDHSHLSLLRNPRVGNAETAKLFPDEGPDGRMIYDDMVSFDRA
jgi:hypothetical protein